MHTILRALKVTATLVTLSLPLGACSVDVTESSSGGNAGVEVRTPVGRISAGNEIDIRQTGLPAYPGARLVREGDDAESANVNINTAWFGVNVVAAEFETDDAPADVIEFYRNALKAHGAVTECRGDVEFKDGATTPTCESESSSDEVQLVTGTEDNQRIVAVKPRGSGSEFAVVYVRTRG